MLCFYGNIRSSNFLYVHNILAEGVFVTQLSHNVGIWVRQSVCVMANCCFM